MDMKHAVAGISTKEVKIAQDQEIWITLKQK